MVSLRILLSEALARRLWLEALDIQPRLTCELFDAPNHRSCLLTFGKHSTKCGQSGFLLPDLALELGKLRVKDLALLHVVFQDLQPHVEFFNLGSKRVNVKVVEGVTEGEHCQREEQQLVALREPADR